MNDDKATIATLFSSGQFEETFEHLSDDIVWSVVGEVTVTGKNAVVVHCQKVAAYFASVETVFATAEVITADNKVIIRGVAKFIKDRKCIKTISACDVYQFDANHKINSIASYCIALKDKSDQSVISK